MENDPLLEPWDQPPDTAEPARRRGAALLWIVGGLEMVLGTCLGCALWGVAMTPISELREQSPGMSEAQWQQFQPLHEQLETWVMPIIAVSVLPGLAYLAMGFYVRAGRKRAVVGSLVLLLAQSLVFALLLVTSLLGSVMQFDPAGATISVLLFGTPLALLLYTAWTVGRITQQPAEA